MSLAILKAIAAEPELVLCTVLRVKGSAPRHAGSKMLAGPQGRILGSVGGGRGEARALATCAQVLAGAPATLLEIDMQGLEAEGPDMVCGGNSLILVEPLAAREPYLAALELLRQGQPALLVKHLATGATGLMDGQGQWVQGGLAGADPASARQALASSKPVLAEPLLYDPLFPEEKLLILGGGHVGCALAALAPGLGFKVTVGEDRPDFLAPARFPAAVAGMAGSFTDIVDRFAWDVATSVVIVTRGHLSDLECVRAVLPKPYRYAGFMGSARKTRLVLEQVATEAFDPLKVAALRAPIGLEIGAETPEELAVAIAAELIAARRQAPCLEAAHGARKARRQVP
jgi:xanthine dehydrogenase accessory factor